MPEDIFLTSFSILFARYKGSLEPMVRGVRALDRIGKGDRILICEGCTHHRQCEDIGTVKLPGWIQEYPEQNRSLCLPQAQSFRMTWQASV